MALFRSHTSRRHGVATILALQAIFGAALLAGQALAQAGKAQPSLPVATTMQVITLQGSASFNNQPVKIGDLLTMSGTLTTGSQSAIKVYSQDLRMIAILQEKSALEVTPPKRKAPASFKLLEGTSRWVVGKAKADQPIEVTTRSAVITSRNGEFMTVYNKILNESEVICFEGSVELKDKDRRSKKAKNLVKRNQWGGIGGRFIESVSKIIDLPPPVIEHFKGQSKLDTQFAAAAVSTEFNGHAIPQ